MPTKTQPADEKLLGRVNMAAYRLGAMHAADLLDERTLTRLFNTIGAVDAIQSAQSKLHYSATGSENEALEKRLDKPIRQLQRTFVRQVDAAIRKLDKSKLSQRNRKALGL